MRPGKRAIAESKEQERANEPAKSKKAKGAAQDAPAKSSSIPPAAAAAPTEEVLERVRVLDRGVRESRQNINNCVELVTILRESVHDAAVFRAAKALQRIFLSFKDQVPLNLDWRRTSSARDFDELISSALPTDKENSAEEIFANWLCKHYVAFHDALAHLLSHKEPSLQIMALEALQELLRVEEERKYTEEEERQPQKIVNELLAVNQWVPKMLEELAKFLDFDDVKLGVLLALQSHTQALAAEAEKDSAKKELLETNVLTILKAIIPRSGAEKLEPFKYLHNNVSDDVIIHEKKDTFDFTQPKAHRKAASAVWLAFLRSPLSPKNFKEALSITHDRIIPSLADPRVLIDFLRNSYDKGGVVSILALHGLFVLIKDWNLDYPDFYRKLYALFEPQIFHVKYRDRFFKLAALFLSSTHMPSYIVAAFIKRLARLALYGAPHVALVCLPFMYNLIRRHPSCAVLIHRPPVEQPVLNLRVENSGAGNDPFKEGETDFEKCHAIDSSLWELELLSKHYHPNVARLAKVFEAGHLEKKSFDLDAFVQLGYASEYSSMSSHKRGAYVPLSNHFPTNLFTNERVKKPNSPPSVLVPKK